MQVPPLRRRSSGSGRNDKKWGVAAPLPKRRRRADEKVVGCGRSAAEAEDPVGMTRKRGEGGVSRR
jgi:hypothetical protein